MINSWACKKMEALEIKTRGCIDEIEKYLAGEVYST